jgi:2-polyprenyl-6-methoxyphenol hydroxylase-like FAD-dependent oxidoreductase
MFASNLMNERSYRRKVMNSPLVLVVGAGPTGMTMAIELKRFGFDVRVIDKSDHQAAHSQALVVQARTLEQLERYGLAAEAVARGRKLNKVRFWSEKKNIVTFALEQIPSPYPYVLFLPQSETETILNAKMESLGVQVERKTELVSFTREEDAVSAVLRHGDGSEEKISPRWIVGCDGAHSTVRERAGIPFEGGGVGLSFFLGDLEVEGPDAPTDELVIHLHKGNVVFMGRLSDKFIRVIVALHSEQGEDSQRELSIRDFQNAVDDAGIQIRIRSSEWMTPFRVNDRQAAQYRAGNVFLAGDASHIHSPVGGQGMNTGIQDAANLAWKLAAVARGADDRLLDSYQEERGEVGKALLRFTERGLKMATASSPWMESVRDVLAPIISGLHSAQKAITAFISETAIEYGSSSIVADHGGDGVLRAGDRMPDLTLRSAGKSSSLLHDWTDGKHLALLLGGTKQEVQQLESGLTHTRIIALPASDFDEEGRRLLGKESKLLIVRPDGYVGFRGSISRPSEWEAYARQDGLNS